MINFHFSMYKNLLLTFLIFQDVENDTPTEDRMLDINEDGREDIFEVSELPETGNIQGHIFFEKQNMKHG